MSTTPEYGVCELCSCRVVRFGDLDWRCVCRACMDDLRRQRAANDPSIPGASHFRYAEASMLLDRYRPTR